MVLAAVFLLVTAWVWQLQLAQDRSLIAAHTQDVGAQAVRRLQIFIDSHLRVARLFAHSWTDDADLGDARQRFESQAAVMLEEFPGLWALHLQRPGASTTWSRERRASSGLAAKVGTGVLDRLGALASRARQQDETLLSPVMTVAPGDRRFAAALALARDGGEQGVLLVEFQADTLFNDCFHSRIRSEFDFSVHDQDQLQFSSAPRRPVGEGARRELVQQQRFAVADRQWRLDIAPRPRQLATLSPAAHLAVPVLGGSFSLCFAFLVHLLLRRARHLRWALERTVRAMVERERAEDALRISESRYHGLFDAASDGLLLLEGSEQIVEANPAAARIVGRPAEQLVGSPLGALLAGGEAQVEALNAQLSQLGQARVDATLRRDDDELVEVELHASRLRAEAGASWLAVINDVSAHQRALRRLRLLSRKALQAQEDERGRLSRELHDELGQLLTALRLELGWLRRQLPAGPEQATDLFDNTVQLAETATEELRRICRGLRPTVLDDLGLEPAARQLLDEFAPGSGIELDTRLQLDADRPPAPEVALCAYRILQESLTNVRRHAGAGQVQVTLRGDSTGLEMEIYDDGVVFEPAELDASQGCGLEGMRERAQLVGGELVVRSARHQGTRVRFTVDRAGAQEEER